MGCAKSCTKFHSQKQLLVATLNYCSIMNSPFEFYCKDLENQLHQISNIFASLLPVYIPNFQKNSFKWSMGKIDKFLRTERQSPLFSSYAGIINDRFMTRKQFEQSWDKKFQQKMGQLQVRYSNEQKQNTKLYDFIALHALLIFVFKKQQYSELIKQSPRVYVKALEPFFQLSFLDEKRKLEKVAEQFLKMEIDIFFIQEFSEAFLHYIERNKQYIVSIDKTKDTMIIAKKTSFVQVRNIETVLSQSHIKNFNIFEGTSFLVVDNLILINVHLSSKTDKNVVQIKNLEQALIKINEKRGLFQVIVAGDLNSFFELSEQIRPHYQMFPVSKEQLTTIKKRTMTQAQYHKGDKIVKESKDKIITTLNMRDCKISMFNSQQSGAKDFIPSNDHPFDHFLVSAVVFK